MTTATTTQTTIAQAFEQAVAIYDLSTKVDNPDRINELLVAMRKLWRRSTGIDRVIITEMGMHMRSRVAN